MGHAHRCHAPTEMPHDQQYISTLPLEKTCDATRASGIAVQYRHNRLLAQAAAAARKRVQKLLHVKCDTFRERRVAVRRVQCLQSRNRLGARRARAHLVNLRGRGCARRRDEREARVHLALRATWLEKDRSKLDELLRAAGNGLGGGNVGGDSDGDGSELHDGVGGWGWFLGERLENERIEFVALGDVVGRPISFEGEQPVLLTGACPHTTFNETNTHRPTVWSRVASHLSGTLF
jgi:hypothetical protein